MSYRIPGVARAAILPLALSLFILPHTFVHAQPSSKRDKPTANHTETKPSAKPDALAIDPELKEAIANAPAASRWPNSNSALLLDLADVTVKSDGTVVAVYRETIKLFNERARDLAEVNLPYNASYQSVEVLRARTIKKNGTVMAVKPEDIRVSSPYNDYALYDDTKSVGFSMPGVEDECVIDYTYRQVTRPLLMPGNFWEYWGFSGLEPVGLSRFTLHVPADKPIKFKVYNSDSVKPTVADAADGRTRVYTWAMHNIEPIEAEPDMPKQKDAVVWMEATSLDSWQDVAKWFWGLSKPQTVPNDAIRETVMKLTADKKTDEEKARAIYDWVANRVRYVGLEFGVSAYKPHPATTVYEKLYGDCKDKAHLLVTMLGLAGIKAYPVLLDTENRRPIHNELPSLTSFDHCIALADVNGKPVWLDATAEACAFGDIPYQDRGSDALVVRDGVGEFKQIPTYQGEENGTHIKSSVALLPDGSALVKTGITATGISGQQMRARIRQITPDQRKTVAQSLAQTFSVGATLKDFTVPDGMDKTGPYEMQLTLSAPKWARKTRNLLLIPASSGGTTDRRNRYVKDKRAWPVVFEDSSVNHEEVNIQVPEGYEVEDLPEDVTISGPLSESRRSVTKSADGKTITIAMTTTTRPGTIPPADYPKIRAYYDDLIKASDDVIVLRKQK